MANWLPSLEDLLTEVTLIGGIYSMGYDECLVLTNDFWKEEAGGIPRHCFLLATPLAPASTPTQADEILLLRVLGPAELPAEEELLYVRAEAMREMVTRRNAADTALSGDVLDVLTRNEIQFCGLKAKVLGTFYNANVNGHPLLAFGSDVESFYASSHYKVYKPCGTSLSVVASYPEITEDEARGSLEELRPAQRMEIGRVRYSSTSRRHREQERSSTIAVPVRVNISDFVAMKSAVFGMTRLGKSNTMKVIATAVCQHAAETGQRVGQLLFDPAGEYANINTQDQTALSQIGPQFVTIFRYAAQGPEPGVRPLSTNFYSNDTIDVTWAIITAYLGPRSQATYIRTFLAADVIGPARPEDDRSSYYRAQRRRAALYATLLKAGFRAPPRFSASVKVSRAIVDMLNRYLEDQPPFQTDAKGYVRLSADSLIPFWDAVLLARDSREPIDDWLDSQLDAILALYRGQVGSGYRILEPLRSFHAPTAFDDYAEAVLRELVDGKIVIVDLSRGAEAILKFCAERIINHLLHDAAQRFAAGLEPHTIQIYLEEAHRLFNRDQLHVPDSNDPYIRLAKEAAKYRIGLIYATQEVTSVDPLILSNTSNWIVAHLNNSAEVKELSKYYEFGDFSDVIVRAEDVGFVRIKMRSGRYVVPLQVALFDKTRVHAAREACLQALERAT